MAVPLPFFRNSSELPAPLPTKQEIHDSATILKGTETWATQKVVVVGQHFLVKYGSRTSQIEGDNLLFVEQNLRIPAPRLYARWQESAGSVTEGRPSRALEGDNQGGRLWRMLASRGIVEARNAQTRPFSLLSAFSAF
jgi:hypothetical protein